MAYVLREALLIDAPVERVWDVIADLPRYPEWNPFVVSARSSLEVGEPILLRVRIFPCFAQSQREIVTECFPGQRLCYGIRPLPARLLRSRRCQEVREANRERAHYRSEFELSGRLAPLTRALFGTRLEAGFRAASRALKRRAEQLHRANPAEGGLRPCS
jgi:hypothetical protein